MTTSAANFGLSAAPAVEQVAHRPAPSHFCWVHKQFLIAVLTVACGLPSLVQRLVRRNSFLWSYAGRHFPSVSSAIAHRLAILNCRLAGFTVPAYAETLRACGIDRSARGLAMYPETNKENYARAYPFADQCRHGHLKMIGSTVDESSGSTGQPFNWVRSAVEVSNTHNLIANYIRLYFPVDNLFCINAFSMGAWATGTTFNAAMQKIAIVKSPGPDVEAIIATLDTFGRDFDYLITAYPPFLKTLSDAMDARGIPAGEYRLYAIVAGEPITETLRHYLRRRFKTILSGYGASDVGVGIAGETPFTVTLRRLIAENAPLRHALLGPDENRIPMIFQYNPFDVFIETNGDSELLFTVIDSASMCPKLRYNLKDEGKIFTIAEVVSILRQHDVGRLFGAETMTGILRLPVLVLFGRSDSTISVMGANIYPQDVECGLYDDPELARQITGFCLGLDEHDDYRSLPTVHVALAQQISGEEKSNLEVVLGRAVSAYLGRVSRDYANARLEDPKTTEIRVCCHVWGEGPFDRGKARIKNRYLAPAAVHG